MTPLHDSMGRGGFTLYDCILASSRTDVRCTIWEIHACGGVPQHTHGSEPFVAPISLELSVSLYGGHHRTPSSSREVIFHPLHPYSSADGVCACVCVYLLVCLAVFPACTMHVPLTCTRCAGFFNRCIDGVRCTFISPTSFQRTALATTLKLLARVTCHASATGKRYLWMFL